MTGGMIRTASVPFHSYLIAINFIVLLTSSPIKLSSIGYVEGSLVSRATSSESIVPTLRNIDESFQESPSEIMRLFNTWGPYTSSYVIMSNLIGLPGKNVIYYPADNIDGGQEQMNLPLASDGKVFPVAVYSYGFNASCFSKPENGGSEHMAFMAHLASWGIVVACPTDRVKDDWDGRVLTRLMNNMETLNFSIFSRFFRRLDTRRFATIGRSYGGNRAINAAAANPRRVAAVISDAQCAASFCTPTEERDVRCPSLYLVGDMDPFVGGIIQNYNKLEVPKQLLITRLRTHDSAPMQVYRTWVTLFVLLHVGGIDRYASTVWGPSFYSTSIEDPEYGIISIGSARVSKYMNYWPLCAVTTENNLAAKYMDCPPTACAESSIVESRGAVSISEIQTITNDESFKGIERTTVLLGNGPSTIEIESTGISDHMHRSSMQRGLMSLLFNDAFVNAMINETGENGFRLTNTTEFDSTACFLLQTFTSFGDACDLEDNGNIKFTPGFKELLFDLILLIDSNFDRSVTYEEIRHSIKRLRRRVSGFESGRGIKDISTVVLQSCGIFDYDPLPTWT